MTHEPSLYLMISVVDRDRFDADPDPDPDPIPSFQHVGKNRTLYYLSRNHQMCLYLNIWTVYRNFMEKIIVYLYNWLIRNRLAGPGCQSGSRSGKMIPIRPDQDPQHC